uniref:Uncharacterized protein n=1 Tax=Wuchereria bancrofti TaxID=6293 RepID=A0AAF5Q6X5_WUCBA
MVTRPSSRPSFNGSSPKGGVADKEKDLISVPREDKLSKESKKQAMGNICNSDDPTKSVIESVVSHSASDNANTREDKLSKESKKQAMGNICNSDDPTKSVIESVVSHSASDNANSQKSSKLLKTDTKST